MIESNDFVASILRNVLVRFGYDARVQVVSQQPKGEDFSVLDVVQPIRVGALLDGVARIIAADDSDNGRFLDLDGRSLDVHSGLYDAGRSLEPVRLTEKEVSLLVMLAAAQPTAVSREVLLDEIWGYAEGVETHTLETHIYRLRQKIEDDPASPQFLKTRDDGYFLSFK